MPAVLHVAPGSPAWRTARSLTSVLKHLDAAEGVVVGANVDARVVGKSEVVALVDAAIVVVAVGVIAVVDVSVVVVGATVVVVGAIVVVVVSVVAVVDATVEEDVVDVEAVVVIAIVGGGAVSTEN